MGKIIIEDRYSALGIPRPDKDSCDECDATGYIPIQASELNSYACNSPKGRVLVVGQKEEDGTPMPDDGWLFLQCPVCEGTRKKQVVES